MMNDTYLSFYLKVNRIHVFIDALRSIGSPSRICFLMEQNGRKLCIAPYEKRDFKSHGVPDEVYSGSGCMEISSKKLCQLIADVHQWDSELSYRVPGVIRKDLNVVLFDLTKAEIIEHEQ